MRTRQLTGMRPGRELRWTRTAEQSVRAYAVVKQEGVWPCVSTRSGELTVVLDGEMVLELGPDKQVVRVRAGEACMVPRRMPHALRLDQSARVLVVDVQGQSAESGFRHLRGRRLPPRGVAPFAAAWGRPAREALPPLVSASEELLRRLGSVDPLVVATTPGMQRAMTIKAMIEQRFAQPPSLGELARLTRTSEFYVMRTFKKHYGFTPMQYAQFLRTEHFCWELIGATTRPTLLRLSGEAGFGDYATFERRMRVAFGRAPSTLVVDDADGPLGPI